MHCGPLFQGVYLHTAYMVLCMFELCSYISSSKRKYCNDIQRSYLNKYLKCCRTLHTQKLITIGHNFFLHSFHLPNSVQWLNSNHIPSMTTKSIPNMGITTKNYCDSSRVSTRFDDFTHFLCIIISLKNQHFHSVNFKKFLRIFDFH